MNAGMLLQGWKFITSDDSRETYVGVALIALVMVPIAYSYFTDE